MFCAYCKKGISPVFLDAGKISRQEKCPHCYGDLHSCKMCALYDTSYARECREPMAENVTDKSKANFCDYFQFNSQLKTGLTPDQEKQRLWEKANSLFKK